jgi:hypothetical protein
LPTNVIPFTIFVLFYRIVAIFKYSEYSETVKTRWRDKSDRELTILYRVFFKKFTDNFDNILQRTTKKVYQALCQNEEFGGFNMGER